MGLIAPGYLTGSYHPDRYFMADYHPEWGYPSVLDGHASVINAFVCDPSIHNTFINEVSDDDLYHTSPDALNILRNNTSVTVNKETPNISPTFNNEVSIT